MSKTTIRKATKHHTIHPNKVLLNSMIASQKPSSNSSFDRMSNQERQEIKSMSRALRKLKRQMFLKHVESSQEPSPVDSFRALIVDLAVQQEATEAYRTRSNSTASYDSSLTRGDSLRSIQEWSACQNFVDTFFYSTTIDRLHELEWSVKRSVYNQGI